MGTSSREPSLGISFDANRNGVYAYQSEMTTDEIIEEIHAFRAARAAKYDHDLEKICAALL